MKVKEIMSDKAEFVYPDTALREAAKKMRDLDIGCLLVCENDRLVGVVTDRDLVIRGMAGERTLESQVIRDVMSASVAFCFEEQELEDVARIMEAKRVRRLAVLNTEKRLAGIVSLDDLARMSFVAGEVLSLIASSWKGKKAA